MLCEKRNKGLSQPIDIAGSNGINSVNNNKILCVVFLCKLTRRGHRGAVVHSAGIKHYDCVVMRRQKRHYRIAVAVLKHKQCAAFNVRIHDFCNAVVAVQVCGIFINNIVGEFIRVKRTAMFGFNRAVNNGNAQVAVIASDPCLKVVCGNLPKTALPVCRAVEAVGMLFKFAFGQRLKTQVFAIAQ